MYSISAYLKRRLPAAGEVRTLFSFVLSLVASWSIYTFLFNLTSYLRHFNVLEIGAVLAYLMAYALLESLVVMFILLLGSLALPGAWFREGFVYKGALLVLVTAAAEFQLQRAVALGNVPPLKSVAVGAVLALALVSALAFLFHYFQRAAAIARAVLAQFEIFAYLYVPLGLIGLLVVVLRNLLQGIP